VTATLENCKLLTNETRS